MGGISILYPQANDRPWSPLSGYMCVYECFIKNEGLCFPTPRLLLQYCHRRRIALSQLTHGSIRTMMVVVVLAAEHGRIVNLDEFEEISSFSPIGNTGRFYVSPRGGYQLVKGHSSQVNRYRWSSRTCEEEDPRGFDYHTPSEEQEPYPSVARLPVVSNRSKLPPVFVRERQKEEARRKLKDEERKKKAEADAKRKKRADEEKEKAKSATEKKRLAQEALGSGDRVEKMFAGYNFLSEARYPLDQKNRKLNVQNGELVAESSRSKEVAKFKDLLDRSQQVNVKKNEVSRIEGEVAQLRSSSKDAVARAVEETKRRAKDKLRRSIEIMEERSKAQTEVDRLSSLVSQVVGAIRRMEKAAKEGAPIDAAKKEKLEARLASYTAEADQIILPSLPTDSSDDEAAEPRRNVALDISSSDSSDEEAERTEVDGRMSITGKTPALTLAEIEEAANIEADQVNQLALKLVGEEAEDNADVAGTEEPAAAEEPYAIEELTAIEEPAAAEEPAATDAVDAATGEPIAPLFPDSNPDRL
ncbi:hypothetical protein AALP_AA6G204800 [Arabis alpina]|uniref:Uncharacterized protein n=1 Tax=Arabis alpina TaxID=50452 RepID=A0A087GQK1_ARAAL|nr:hypothetical protein AALP_AA6G204800 [Arabis alpina]